MVAIPSIGSNRGDRTRQFEVLHVLHYSLFCTLYYLNNPYAAPCMFCDIINASKSQPKLPILGTIL
jgi:hypothetical protein